MQFIDTNILIRYLTKDDPKKAQACLELFQKAERGQVTLTISEFSIAELVFILASKKLYSLSRDEIRQRLYPVLSIPAPGLSLPHRNDYLRALDLYVRHPVDFQDAIALAQMERQEIAEIYSYDREFARVGGIKRLEPKTQEVH